MCINTSKIKPPRARFLQRFVFTHSFALTIQKLVFRISSSFASKKAYSASNLESYRLSVTIHEANISSLFNCLLLHNLGASELDIILHTRPQCTALRFLLVRCQYAIRFVDKSRRKRQRMKIDEATKQIFDSSVRVAVKKCSEGERLK